MNEFAVLAQLTVVAMVPYLLASLGTMLGGLAGVFSVSQEGVMLLGAAIGFLVSYGTGSTTIGILLAAGTGAVFGAALGWATTVSCAREANSVTRLASRGGPRSRRRAAGRSGSAPR